MRDKDFRDVFVRCKKAGKSLYFDKEKTMIKITNIEVTGWEATIRGMRNPMNSWTRSDSGYVADDLFPGEPRFDSEYRLGPNDYDLMMQLAEGGPVHAKYRRMIVVYADILAPLYWWKEFDTYKVGTVANSCSTMHKIQEKEFTLEDFSHEHFEDVCHKNGKSEGTYVIDLDVSIEDALGLGYTGGLHLSPYGMMDITIAILNKARALYLKTNDKRYWWQMIQLLPSSYNQLRTVMMNYEVLHHIYRSPWRNHKLDEWREFCQWSETLPYSDIIVGEEKGVLREGPEDGGTFALASAT